MDDFDEEDPNVCFYCGDLIEDHVEEDGVYFCVG